MKKPGKKKMGKVSAGYLERAAFHYLGRFSSTEHNLRQVLARKVSRRNEDNTPPTEEQLGWIDDVVKKCVAYGYVDDANYARQRAENLLRKGKPVRQIAQDLRHKGVGGEHAKAALSLLESGDEGEGVSPDVRAAAAYARRRRFGPFRRTDQNADDKRQKELAAMMRTGFSYRLALDTLDATEDELLALLD